MKTTIRHECEICGFGSAKEEEVLACEAQGAPGKFKKDDKVIVSGTLENGTLVEYPGSIAIIGVEPKTHKLQNYGVMTAIGMAVCVPEEDIRFIENAEPAMTPQ